MGTLGVHDPAGQAPKHGAEATCGRLHEHEPGRGKLHHGDGALGLEQVHVRAGRVPLAAEAQDEASGDSGAGFSVDHRDESIMPTDGFSASDLLQGPPPLQV